MARAPLDNASMKAWSERLDKELRDRMKWQLKYGKESSTDGEPRPSDPQAETLRRYVKRQMNAPAPEPTPPKTRLSNKVKAEIKMQEEMEKARKEKKLDIDELLRDMRPPSASTKALLYKGFSAIGEGRQQYLDARRDKGPEEKYKFPLTGNYEYGWRINDQVDGYRAPTHGRSHIIQESFYRSNGLSLF
ncbi:protein SPMIP1-like [Ptychodera flava]|uniref:protein SPMIP1-like n=1 Tax=Ptychodera flava TaxID=63121 RepID=UPI00396AA0DB